MANGTALEMRSTGNCTVGSNPTLSAITHAKTIDFIDFFQRSNQPTLTATLTQAWDAGATLSSGRQWSASVVARNHTVNSSLVEAKFVPAIREVWLRQALHWCSSRPSWLTMQ